MTKKQLLVVSDYHEDGRVVSNFIVQALSNNPITVYGDGTQTRSFCFVDDLVEGLISLMKSNYKRPVILGNPDEYSMLQFAELVKQTIGSDSEIVFHDLPIDDPKKRCPDISLANETLDWSPIISLEEGLQHTIKWYMNIVDRSK